MSPEQKQTNKQKLSSGGYDGTPPDSLFRINTATDTAINNQYFSARDIWGYTGNCHKLKETWFMKGWPEANTG